MKCFIRSFLLFLSVFCFSAGFAQTVLNIKKDFGARGNGKADDTKAFQRAAERINRLKENVTLLIPKGNYKVVPQQATSSENASPFSPLPVIALTGCTKIVVKGDPGAKILYAPNLYFGSFKRNGKTVEKLEKITTDYRFRAAVGHGIELTNCKNIKIQTLEIDGNNRNFILGGQFGDVGIQIDNDGAFIANSSDVVLSNLYLHHFGRDGLQVINQTPQQFQTPSQKIVLENCRFDYNGRQGFSWTGGVGLRAVNCSFLNSGKGKFASPPGAGVDFEPNAGYIVRDGTFVQCTFEGNSGVGVIADAGGFQVRDISFEKCRMVGSQSPALWVKSPAFRFANCNIIGGFLFGCPATSKEDGTLFTNCVFQDDAGTEKKYLVESNGSRYMQFQNCTFRAGYKGVVYVVANATKNEERAVFQGCRFVMKYEKNIIASRIPGSVTNGVSFAGNNAFVDSSAKGLSYNIANSAFLGMPDSRNQTIVFTNNSLASFETVTIGNEAQAHELILQQNSALLINHNAKLNIGEMGIITIKKGGVLWIAPNATLTIKGKIFAEDGAFLCIHQQAKLSPEALQHIVLKGNVSFSENPAYRLGISGCIKVE